MKHRILTVYWKDSDETLIEFSPFFEVSDRILKLDVLSDVVANLQNEYSEIFSDTIKPPALLKLSKLARKLASNPESREEFLKMVKAIKPKLPKEKND